MIDEPISILAINAFFALVRRLNESVNFSTAAYCEEKVMTSPTARKLATATPEAKNRDRSIGILWVETNSHHRKFKKSRIYKKFDKKLIAT